MSGMGCDNAWHLCAITSANNSHEHRTRSRQVSRLQDSKTPEHLADPPVHTDCNRNSWRMEQSSKRIHHRTWETYHHCHQVNKRDKLYLSASLSGNSERQHAFFHWVIHHRHELNTNNNNSNDSDDSNNINNWRQCPYDTTVTEDTKEFLFFRIIINNNNNDTNSNTNNNNFFII